MYSVFLLLLAQKGVSVADVSRATGINQSTFSNWKARGNLISGKNAKLIADYFDVSVDYLMTGKFKSHYMDEDTAKMAQEAFESPEMRLLFDAARGSTAEDILFARDILLKLKKGSEND